MYVRSLLCFSFSLSDRVSITHQLCSRGECRYDLKQGTVPYVISLSSAVHRLTATVPRDFEEPGVESARRTREARGGPAQGVEGDEAQAGRRRPRLSVSQLVMRGICAAVEGRSFVTASGCRVWQHVYERTCGERLVVMCIPQCHLPDTIVRSHFLRSKIVQSKS